ncbi:hypothetical protein BT69DRAFT_1353215 [Atractiella rhizophila]|nr:hypothetical protein BT69DRAFT_1353215 [Atractiella rhizophila]
MSSSNCITCGATPPCPGCSSSQVCIQTVRSCTACAESVCVDAPQSNTGTTKKGGGSSPVGPAVGSVVGILVIAGVIGWVWWLKKKKRERERKERREQREKKKSMLPQGNKGEKAEVSAVSAGKDGTVVKRKSLSRLSPNQANFPEGPSSGASLTSSMEVNGHSTSAARDPFSDQNAVEDDDRSDTYTFRSSQSTSIIPIAYIPAHSSSPAIGDLQGMGPYGEHERPEPSRDLKRDSKRESMGIENIRVDLTSPPPLVSSPGGGIMKINGVPIRPPRAPDLDLKLPEDKKKLLAPTTSGAPSSGSLSPVDPLLGSRLGAESRMSTLSTTSSSMDSHLSYILDSPQIVTPHSLRTAGKGTGHEVKRVEVLGVAKVGLTTLKRSNSTAANGGDKSPALPLPSSGETTPVKPTDDPFSDRNAIAAAKGAAAEKKKGHSPMDSLSNVNSLLPNHQQRPDTAQSHNTEYSYSTGRTGSTRSRESEVSINMEGDMLDVDSDQKTLRGGRAGPPGGPRSPGWLTSPQNSMAVQQHRIDVGEDDDVSDRDSIWTSTSAGGDVSRSNSIIIGTAAKLPLPPNMSAPSSVAPTSSMSQASAPLPPPPALPLDPHMSYASSARDSMASQSSNGVLDGIPFQIGFPGARDSTASGVSVFTTNSRFSDYQGHFPNGSQSSFVAPPLPSGAQGRIEKHQNSNMLPPPTPLRQEILVSPPASSTASSFEMPISVSGSDHERNAQDKKEKDRSSIDTLALSAELAAQFEHM